MFKITYTWALLARMRKLPNGLKVLLFSAIFLSTCGANFVPRHGALRVLHWATFVATYLVLGPRAEVKGTYLLADATNRLLNKLQDRCNNPRKKKFDITLRKE